LDLEKSLLSYLNIYGNTKESDFVEFGVTFSGKSKEELAKILDDMIDNGSVQRIIHHLIESNAVYIGKVPLWSSFESRCVGCKKADV